MAKPCGCAGSCGCDIRGRNGVKTTGTGVAPDTLWIELDGSSPSACATIMDCVGANIGNGLIYNAGTRRLSVRLSNTAGNQATIGADGGIMVTGSGGGGGSSGQTVANLPAGINTIIGSGWGAGSMMWPEGVRESILAARNMVGTAVRMVYLPLRRSSNMVPIVLSEHFMSWYLGDGVVQTPMTLDDREHSMARYLPGGNPPSAEGGYMNFYQPISVGTPTLGESLAALARRAVIVLECRDTVSPGETTDRVKEMVPQYEAQSSIIVSAEPIASTGPNGPTILDAISASMSGSGMPIGAVFRTRQEVLDCPPSRLATLGVTWVFVQENLVDPVDPNHVSTQVEAYRVAGLNVMLLDVHRQYQAARAAALQLRGSVCSDPVYAYGAASLYRYRRDAPSWNSVAPNYGQHSSWSNTLAGRAGFFRGFVEENALGQPFLQPSLHNPEQVEPYQSAYWILPGEILPLRNADTYAVQCWWRWNGSLPDDRSRFVALWLDSPTDRSLREWTAATAQTIGYQFIMSADNRFTLVEYDGTPGAPPNERVLVDTPLPYSISPNVYYGMRAEMTPTALRLYASSTSWPNAFNKILVATVPNPHRYIAGVNNGYLYFGRHYFEDNTARQNQIAGLAVQYSGF